MNAKSIDDNGPIERAGRGGIVRGRTDHTCEVPHPVTTTNERNARAYECHVLHGDALARNAEQIISQVQPLCSDKGVRSDNDGNMIERKTGDEVTGQFSELNIGNEE